MDEDRPSDHEFSSGQGFDDVDYEAFDIDPEVALEPGEVDPFDSHALLDRLDEDQIPSDRVDAERLLEVGIEKTRLQRHEEATTTLERAARFAEDDRIEQEAWVNKGAAHAEREEFDAAIGAYEEALRIDDDSDHAATARSNLVYALYESGRGEQALEHAERAVETDPRFAEAWYNYGFVLAERGRHEAAVEKLDNAVRLGMRGADVHEERARSLEAIDEDEAAETARERAEAIREEREAALVDAAAEDAAEDDASFDSLREGDG